MKQFWLYLKSLGTVKQLMVIDATVLLSGAGAVAVLQMNDGSQVARPQDSSHVPIDPNVDQNNEDLKEMPDGQGIAIWDFIP